MKDRTGAEMYQFYKNKEKCLNTWTNVYVCDIYSIEWGKKYGKKRNKNRFMGK